jgi:hypothetical protein
MKVRDIKLIETELERCFRFPTPPCGVAWNNHILRPIAIHSSPAMGAFFTRKKLASLLTAMSLLIVLLSSSVASAQPGSREAKQREAWRDSMVLTAPRGNGSFVATYPGKIWRAVPSVKAPLIPMVPRKGPRPFVVGNGNDVSAQAPSGRISSATGSFDNVTGVTSESGPIGNAGPAVTNAYTLQLNTDHFASTLPGSPAGCQGWAQFLFANNGASGSVYIQYWLINYGTTSPGAGWMQGPAPLFTSDWYRNSSATGVTNQPISNLANLSLSSTVSATQDRVFLSTGSQMYMSSGPNEVNASTSWTIAEFNIFGYGGNGSGGGMASFNAGSVIVPRTRISYGGREAPVCSVSGFTAETNNLSFGPTAPGASGSGPAVFATESSGGGAMGNCTAATTIGDTHLTTFGGLLYDFQASGDFVLAEVDSDFVVQTRQVSGAPTWPNATVNSAVATRMGKTKVAVCLSSGLFIDNVPTELADGKSLSTPGGVDVSRKGNVYFITSANGNSVRATVNPSYIDVLVGIGSCCGHKLQGLLANPGGNVNQIAARDGTVLSNPFNFDEFYHHYADSWRVSPEESLLPVCGKPGDLGIPAKPFFARDLDQKVFEHARTVATTAGVKEGPLLDAATLDVAVIGNDNAANAFVGMHAPIAVGSFVNSSSGHGLSGSVWWLLLAVLAAFMVWVFLRRRRR